MAVYRRFADQEALFDGVAAALFDEIDVATLPWAGSWRETLEGLLAKWEFPPLDGVFENALYVGGFNVWKHEKKRTSMA